MKKLLLAACLMVSFCALAQAERKTLLSERLFCISTETLDVYSMLIMAQDKINFKKEVADYDPKGDKCFVSTMDLPVIVTGKKEGLVGKIVEFELTRGDKKLYTLTNSFKQ